MSTYTMGDVGEEEREIEILPLTEPAIAPVEPAPAQPEPEEVPA